MVDAPVPITDTKEPAASAPGETTRQWQRRIRRIRSPRRCWSRRSRSTACAVCTESADARRSFDLEAPWRLHPQVAIRPERFGALLYHFGTRRLSFLKSRALLEVVRSLDDACQCSRRVRGRRGGRRRAAGLRAALATLASSARSICARNARRRATARAGALVEEFQLGLDAPICLTWELTYACNLSCVHCLSLVGRRDPRELSTAECQAVIDELERMQVFYVNIGGGEPTVRPDFWELVDYATAHHVGVKFSTNGVQITPSCAARLAASDYVDVQISLDGATAEVNDAVRGAGSYDTALRAMGNLADAGFAGFKISVVMTRHNVGQLDEFKAIADRYGAQLRLTRLRPSGRGADVWDELHPTADQQRAALRLAARARRERADRRLVLPPRRGTASALPGLNLCGAGRVVCLIDPVGDVYACPFAIHDDVPGRQRPRRRAGSPRSGAVGAVRRAAAARRPAAPARPARRSTRAAAAAWPPSSSPACRSTARTRNACKGLRRATRWPLRRDRRRGRRRPLAPGPAQPLGAADRSAGGRASSRETVQRR